MKPDPRKTQDVAEFPRRRNRKNIKQFVGLAGYYRRFIPNFAKIARPLNDLLKRDVMFLCGNPREQAFNQLKDLGECTRKTSTVRDVALNEPVSAARCADRFGKVHEDLGKETFVRDVACMSPPLRNWAEHPLVCRADNLAINVRGTTNNSEGESYSDEDGKIIRINFCDLGHDQGVLSKQVLSVNPVEYSRDQLFAHSDNLGPILSADCQATTPVCQQLIDLRYIDLEKLKKHDTGVV